MTLPVVATTWTFKDKSLFEALDIVHLLGFSDVELWAEGVHLDPRGELPDVAELASALDRLGLTAHSIHAPFRGLDLTAADGGVRRRAVTAISHMIEIAAELDCPFVVVHVDGGGNRAPRAASSRDTTTDAATAAAPDTATMSGAEPRAATAVGAESGTREAFVGRAEALERAAAALAVLCKHADDLGVTILIENQPDPTGQRIGARVAELRQLIEMVGASNIGICFDVAHAAVSTGHWEDELQSALPHLRSVHGSDTEGTRDSHLPLGEGGIAWSEVLAGLEDGGFDGGFVLEVAGGETSVERSLDALRSREAD